MRLEQLQYFLEISTSKSISVAAENLYISQPALSRSIKALEEELGVSLLFRAVDGVRLTQAGKELLPFMREVLTKASELTKASQQCIHAATPTENLSGQLTVFTIPVIADILLLPALEQMSQLFPQIDIHIQITDFNDPCQIAFPENADLLIWMNVDNILDQALKDIHIHMETLFTDNFSIVVSQNHELAKKKIVTLEEALTYKLVAHHNGLNLDNFYHNFTKHDDPLDIILKSNNNRVITQALIKQDAVLITNNQTIQADYHNNDQLITIPLKNRKGTYFCLYDVNNPFLPVIKNFITVLKSVRAGI